MLTTKVNEVVRELENFFVAKYVQLTKAGWSYYEDDSAPCSLSGLKKYGKNLPISTVGNDTSIYRRCQGIQARFWHDVTHLERDTEFDVNGEFETIQAQLQELDVAGISQTAQRLFLIDMWGQVVFYDVHEEYVPDQTEFVLTAMMFDIEQAVNICGEELV